MGVTGTGGRGGPGVESCAYGRKSCEAGQCSGAERGEGGEAGGRAGPQAGGRDGPDAALGWRGLRWRQRHLSRSWGGCPAGGRGMIESCPSGARPGSSRGAARGRERAPSRKLRLHARKGIRPGGAE